MNDNKFPITFDYMDEEKKVYSTLTEEELTQIRTSKKLTKANIESLAKDIKLWARMNRDVGSDYSLLYNGKHEYNEYKCVQKPCGKYEWKTIHRVEENQDPHKWSEWFSENFILGFTVDGKMYRMLNYGDHHLAKAKLEVLLKMYNLYLECCEPCYWEVAPLEDMEVEYTVWKKEKILWLYNDHDANQYMIPEIGNIMNIWYQLSAEVGDKGSCVIGEYMEFRYKGIKYRMAAQSPWQGSYSWEVNVEKIKSMLREIGCEDIHMNYGRLD